MIDVQPEQRGMLDGTLIANDTFFFCVLGLVLLGVFALCAYSKRLSNNSRRVVGRAELIDETGQDTINDSRFNISSGEDIEVDYTVKRSLQKASTSEIELESRPYKPKPASEESEEASEEDEEVSEEEEVSGEEEEEEEVSEDEEEKEVQLDKE